MLFAFFCNRRRVSGHSTNLGQSHGANSADGAQTATSASIASIILAQVNNKNLFYFTKV